MGLAPGVHGALAVEVECRPGSRRTVCKQTKEHTEEAVETELVLQLALESGKSLLKRTAVAARELAVVPSRHTAWRVAVLRKPCLSASHGTGPARRGTYALPDPQACGIVLAVVLSWAVAQTGEG